MGTQLVVTNVVTDVTVTNLIKVTVTNVTTIWCPSSLSAILDVRVCMHASMYHSIYASLYISFFVHT